MLDFTFIIIKTIVHLNNFKLLKMEPEIPCGM